MEIEGERKAKKGKIEMRSTSSKHLQLPNHGKTCPSPRDVGRSAQNEKRRW